VANVTLDDVIALVEQLPERDRVALLAHLRAEMVSEPDLVTRESLLAEHARLKASGAFERAGSLLGRYARPELDLTEEQVDADLRQIRTEWEKEIDEFPPDR
jgi:hypothetical protein